MISTYLEFWNMALGKNDPFFRVFMIIWLVIYTLSWIYFVVAYVLTCLSLHTIAKRRGVLHPWLAWIPVGNLWILGSISDRYQSVVNGKQRKFRMRLMLLSVAVIVTYTFAALFSVHMIDTVDTVNTFSKIAIVIAYMGFLFASVAAVITTAVFGYICLYDVYKSCAPRQTMTYLMLSIFVNVTVPFFLFRCRELELGMAAKEEKTGQIGDCAEEHDLL